MENTTKRKEKRSFYPKISPWTTIYLTDCIRCSGGEDMDGCKMQNFCHPKYSSSLSGNGGLCPESCPVQCGQDQQICPGKEYDGCREPDQCWSKMSMGPKGKECYENCPVYCKDEEIMVRFGNLFESGHFCPNLDTFVQMWTLLSKSCIVVSRRGGHGWLQDV